jgi:hypothetical protein
MQGVEDYTHRIVFQVLAGTRKFVGHLARSVFLLVLTNTEGGVDGFDEDSEYGAGTDEECEEDLLVEHMWD